MKKKQYSYLDVDTKRAEEQRVVITEQKEYMEWKKNFLLQKYKEEKELREIEYKENKLRLDEKHCLEMKVLKLKEMKLLRDLGLESNEPWIMEPKTIQVPLSILTYLIPEEISATNRLIYYWKIIYIVYTEEC